MQDLADKQTIETLHLIHPAYGHKRVALALGWGHNKAQRIMAKYNLRPPRRRAKKLWLTRAVEDCRYTNLIRNVIAYRPSQIYATDLTYLKYRGSFLYLASVEDLFTREIMGANLSDKHDHLLALASIREAVMRSIPEIFHFDQGTEFLAQEVVKYLEDLFVKISVSDRASPWQNGYKESFFGRFKDEFGDPDRFDTLGELIEEIYAYVFYYNNLRIHTSLKMPPVVFRKQFLDADSVSQKSGT